MSTRRVSGQLGLSLVEQIVFIAIVGVAVTGVLAVFVTTSRGSADPMIQKQALAIAEAVMEEVQLQPFTYCDPDDANAATATSVAGCAAANENNLAPEAINEPPGGAAETRAGADRPFDNVNDYNGFAMGPSISNIGGTAIAGLDGYSASVTVANQALGGVNATESLLIAVTVTGPGSTTVTLHGYRTRYAPNALP